MEIVQTSIAGTLESSDIMITFEPDSEGITINLQSVVEKQFGREIRRAILETLSALQVKNVKISAVDKGALDCTIRARIKTAAYRGAALTQYDWWIEK
jgi:citrate lyase subunit gamma (acyl carrier protein)